MNRGEKDEVVRKALWATAVFNLSAAILLAFPERIGGFAGLPLPVPRLYTTLLAMFVLLFGGVYVWLARSQKIDRPMVAFAAIGKTSVFVVVAAFWSADNAGPLLLATASGDLLFAAIFAWWLAGPAD